MKFLNNYKISIVSGIYFPPQDLFRMFLDSCIGSSQTDVEFILLLDDPNDIESRKVLNEYKERFKTSKNSFVIIENEQNLGTHTAFKKGLLQSSGEYVAFFDSDDHFDPDYLETIYKTISSTNSSVIKGKAITHHFGELDVLMEFLLRNESSNEDNWLYFFKRDLILKYIDKYTFVQTTNFISCFNLSNDEMLDFADIAETTESSFYHYVRHSNNCSKFLVNNIDGENADQVGCRTNIKQYLLPSIEEVGIKIDEFTSEDSLKRELLKYTILDEQSNAYLSYKELSEFSTIPSDKIKEIQHAIKSIQDKQIPHKEIFIDYKYLLQVINLIKFSGILNKFTIVTDSTAPFDDLESKYTDLKIKYEK